MMSLYLHHTPPIPLLRRRDVGKRCKVNIPGTGNLFVCFVPFQVLGLIDRLSLKRVAVCSMQRPGNGPFPFRSCPCRSVPHLERTMGFNEFTTPFVKTMNGCSAKFCCRLQQLSTYICCKTRSLGRKSPR